MTSSSIMVKRIAKLQSKSYKYTLVGEDEDKQYFILSRMLKIESYLESLPFTKIKLFDRDEDEDEDEDHIDPFEAKLPTLQYFFFTTHSEGYSNYYLFCKNLKTDEVNERFGDLRKKNS